MPRSKLRKCITKSQIFIINSTRYEICNFIICIDNLSNYTTSETTTYTGDLTININRSEVECGSNYYTKYILVKHLVHIATYLGGACVGRAPMIRWLIIYLRVLIVIYVYNLVGIFIVSAHGPFYFDLNNLSNENETNLHVLSWSYLAH